MSGENDHRERPETALEEVLQEAEEAQKRNVDGDGDDERDGGEAADAITPNVRAQEESRGN
ncbi:hypothetical protein QQY24_03490 [Streptomyces sp. TG1A-8]|uniref:hypothetical protein n=1 Tax=Streptomyces sp. TG1A-8 TaxID=3051385 RepID=UPI00265BF3B3|nr:hypothetical protein [Streptomyces sp. TG1A-8]MDO0924526.1 hypothetical protein [Streptomyces sp. TG1A-8]